MVETYYVLVVVIAILSAGIFLTGGIINIPEQFGFGGSNLQGLVFVGAALSVAAIVLAGIADRKRA